MKITYSTEKINPFGRINFVNKTIENTGIFQLINNELGKSPAQAEYSKTTERFILFATKYCTYPHSAGR